MAGPEAHDAAMLEEAADDAFHADAFRQTRHARAQAADAANDELDRDAGLTRPIERIDDTGIDERVHLRPDRGGLAGPRMRDFLFNQGHEVLAQRQRREAEL